MPAIASADSEADVLRALRRRTRLYDSRTDQIGRSTRELVASLRSCKRGPSVFERMLGQFSLATDEGLALMGLAETLIRVPDDTTALAVVRRQLGRGDWKRAISSAPTRLLALSARALKWGRALADEPIAGSVVLSTARQTMRVLGNQFILGSDMRHAIRQAHGHSSEGLYSFDLLGEGARTLEDADAYRISLLAAIEELKTDDREIEHSKTWRGPPELSRYSLSVKLSALEPRYEEAQRTLVLQRLVPVLTSVFKAAASGGLAVTIDAEEQDRLELSLDVLAAALESPALAQWSGAGLAVQAYGTRAIQVIEWAASLARARGVPLHVRLVKGAYWDTEIKRAQERGLAAYPVFTRKAATDISYLAAAELLFDHSGVLWPQFATHNAHTLSAVRELSEGRPYELQRLHGMGDRLYRTAASIHSDLPIVRVYAPVGDHRSLLPYLVRRLMENSANSSFLSQQDDPAFTPDMLATDPVATLDSSLAGLSLPVELFGSERRNSQGMDLGRAETWRVLDAWRDKAIHEPPRLTGPCVAGVWSVGDTTTVRSPADVADEIGAYRPTTSREALLALADAHATQREWARRSADDRAACLERAADLLEAGVAELLPLLVRESGKCWPDAIAELREAIDFCRYYAARGRELGTAIALPGPTGEANSLTWHGRGVFYCIAPWNFPLAIFIGQIAAALAAGNAVLAKPAPQTTLIGARAVQILFDAGIPPGALQFLPGDGLAVSEAVLPDSRLAGVAFTGSSATARRLNLALAQREGPIVPLIAETGGINAMLVDSTALLEQVVDDVITSAFRSAGQRCSALRLLCLQEDIADAAITMLKGAMNTLTVGDPANPATDVGPLIDRQALDRIADHLGKLPATARILHQNAIGLGAESGYFCAATLVELADARDLSHEVFGPVLHVVRFRSEDLSALIEAIQSSGYGLTMGIHTRLSERAEQITNASRVGNTYVNRNMVGAVVGTQPFGGEGLSGTGPKAGGPHYVMRFAVERVVTVNETAWGGNVALLRGDGS